MSTPEPMSRLRQLRTAAHMTQNGLAKKIGKSHTYVWSVEAGQVALTARDTIEAWADALRVKPDHIYRAIDTVPHDIIDELTKADPDTWALVRKLVRQFNESDQ